MVFQCYVILLLLLLVIKDYKCLAEISIINISSLMNKTRDNVDEINIVKSAIVDSFINHGLFIAIDHGISRDDIKLYHKLLIDLFTVPDVEKSRNSAKIPENRGFFKYGSESGLRDVIYEPKESFSYGYDWSHNFNSNNSLQVVNKWPNSFSITSQMELNSFFNKMRNIVSNIIDAIFSDKVDYDSSSLTDKDNISIMRMFKYYKNSEFNLDYEKRDCLGSSPHTDWGLLTAISQNSVDGLQYFYNQQWVNINIPENGIAINAGDFLSIVSNGKFKSPIHRVLCPDDKNVRNSFVLFYYPSYDSQIPSSPIINDFCNNTDTEGDILYNTLTRSQHKNFNKSTSFGDYIINKWDEVQNVKR